MNLALNRVGANCTFTLDILPMTALATLVIPAFNLPAGRTFRTTVAINATPARVMPKPVSSTTTGTAFPATTKTLRMHRPLDSAGQVNFLVLIEEQVAGQWKFYDSTMNSGHSQTVTQAPAVLATKPKFGVNAHIMIPKLRAAGTLTPMLNRVAGSQVKLVRASAPWQYLEPAAGGIFDATAQAQCDAFANYLRTNNMKWVVALAPVPAAWETGDANILIAQNWADYDSFLDRFLARYGDIIDVVQNNNEPNSSSNPLIGRNGWTWATALTGQQHLYNRVQAYNSANGASIKVSAFAVAFGDAAFVESMYVNGFGPYMDLVDIHPYNTRFDIGGNVAPDGLHAGVTGNPEIGWGDEAGRQYDLLHGIQAVAEVMASHGDGAKQILVSEWGCSNTFTGVGKKKSTLDVTITQQATQATTVVRQVARDSRVYGFLWYSLYDNAYDTNGPIAYDVGQWKVGFGLQSPYGTTTKPSLTAYLNITANPT